jgi:hypothetical protein
MADQQEPKARYPKAEGLPKGAKHGYLGDVEVYDPNDPGASNVTHETAPTEDATTPVTGSTGTIKSDDTPPK